jgi:hypothetical protein
MGCHRTDGLAGALAMMLSGVAATPLAAQVVSHRIKVTGVGGFGSSVAVSCGVFAAGQASAGGSGENGGAAYVLDRVTGEELLRVAPEEDQRYSEFAWSLTMDESGGFVVAGVPVWEEESRPSGAAFVFGLGSGRQSFKLLSPYQTAHSRFGHSLATDGECIVVGAPWEHHGGRYGSAHIFDAATGEHLLHLIPDRPIQNSGFGESVAIDGGIIAVGAYYAGYPGTRDGTAYLFEAATGFQLGQLAPDDDSPPEYLGASIALLNGLVAVGASGAYTGRPGAVYCFDAETGVQVMKLQAPDERPDDEFGACVAMADGLLVVGAPRAGNAGYSSGAAYVFDLRTGELVCKLVPDQPVSGRFGASIAVEKGVAVVGARMESGGAAYTFGLACPADFDGSGRIDAEDVARYLDAWVGSHPSADWRIDGVVDTRDAIEYLGAWTEGC